MSAMTSKRSYDEGCAAAHALDLVGERWALLVVRELLLGPKRFTDLRAGLPHVSPNVLAQRLRDLEQVGVVRRHKLPPPAASRVYELTDWGKELEAVIAQLVRWGVRSASMPYEAPLGTDPLILTMRTMFRSQEAADFEASLELRIGEDRFRARVEKGRLELVRRSCEKPDAVIEGDPDTLKRLAFGGSSPSEPLRTGKLKISGDAEVAKRFLGFFKLPELDEEATAS
jgi:DNA-binding HxlR family transcriptional regulator/putative sterol carrier protein